MGFLYRKCRIICTGRVGIGRVRPAQPKLLRRSGLGHAPDAMAFMRKLDAPKFSCCRGGFETRPYGVS